MKTPLTAPMRKTISAMMLAGAVAASALIPTPVRAASDNEQALWLLLGAATVYGIAKEVERDQKNEKKKKKQRQAEEAARLEAEAEAARRHGDIYPAHGSYGYSYNGHRPNTVPAPLPQHRPAKKARERVLPLQCLHTADGKKHKRQVIGQTCLKKAGYEGRLPQSCFIWTDTKRGPMPGYGASCLVQKGYVIGATRN